jgi:hypothetical protein
VTRTQTLYWEYCPKCSHVKWDPSRILWHSLQSFTKIIFAARQESKRERTEGDPELRKERIKSREKQVSQNVLICQSAATFSSPRCDIWTTLNQVRSTDDYWQAQVV